MLDLGNSSGEWIEGWTNMSADNHTPHTHPNCYHEPVTYTRFLLVVVIGTPLAGLGIVCNSLLIGLLFRRQYQASPMLYSAVLAFLDVLICATYIFLFTFDAVGLYYHIEPLWRLWHYYVMPLLALSRITQLASTYMVLCATTERFFMVYDVKWPGVAFVKSSSGRKVIILTVLLISFVLRVPTYFEWEIRPQDCPAFEDLGFFPGIAINTFYADIYQLYIMQFLQLFIPFLSLCVLNVVIVVKMRQQLAREEIEERLSRVCQVTEDEEELNERSYCLANPQAPPLSSTTPYIRTATLVPDMSSGNKKKLKAATYTMVAIVSSYLACNSLDVAVKTLEKVNKASLYIDAAETQANAFYTISTDIISLLFMFNSFLRLSIYLLCSREVRKDFAEFYGLRRRASSIRTRFEAPSPALEAYECAERGKGKEANGAAVLANPAAPEHETQLQLYIYKL